MSDAFGFPRTALILGGGSDIGRAVVDRLADEGLEHVALAGRDEEQLQTAAERCRANGMRADVFAWNARDAADHAGLMQRAAAALGDIDVVVCAVGKLGHGAGSSVGPPAVWDLFADNASGPAAALTAAAQHLVAQGHGSVVVISSVAALRPRRSNYVYGAAKAGLDAFTRGLADALAGTPPCACTSSGRASFVRR
jgi:decaprenylphospho-beta-D-erythro-pentofuranosid-2-ulose 2-reductase